MDTILKSNTVFIAYSTHDRKIANDLRKNLEANNLHPWIDFTSIESGSYWEPTIERAIQDSAFFIALISRKVIESSSYVLKECRMALSYNETLPPNFNYIFPVLIEEVELPNLKVGTSKFIESQAYHYYKHKSFSKLIDTISRESLKRKKFPTKRAEESMKEKDYLTIEEPSITNTEKLISGAVLYGKVRNFLKLPNVDQTINVIEKYFIRKYVEHHLELRLVHFSGGSIIIFIKKQSTESAEKTAFKALLYGTIMQLIAAEKEFQIGVTIDWDQDAEIKSIDGNTHLVCKAVDSAKKYMTFSDKDHFFMSEDIYGIFKKGNVYATIEGGNLNSRTFMNFLTEVKQNLNLESDGLTNRILNDIDSIYSKNKNDVVGSKIEIPPFTFFDRLYNNYSLHNFFATDANINIGKSYIPYHWTYLENRDKREFTPRQKFIRRLKWAEKVCIIGITHEKTSVFIQTALDERKGKFWNELKIVFPSEKIVEKIIDERDTEERIKAWKRGVMSLSKFLINIDKEKGIKKWQLLEFNGNLPFIGNRLIGSNYKEPSFIRIAPILPKASAKEVYYTEIIDGTDAYAQLSDAFDRICEMSKPIIERLIYGQYISKSGELKYRGLVERTKFFNFIEKANVSNCFPVSLIILHYFDYDAKKNYLLLQNRTKLNSGSNIGFISNLSAHLVDFDAFASSINNTPISKYNNTISEILNNETANRGKRIIQRIEEAFGTLMPNLSKMNMPLEVFRKAAARRLMEELGLEVVEDRLSFHKSFYSPRGAYSYYFKVFSFELKMRDYDEIVANKLDADLGKYSIKDCRDKAGQLNRLLQEKLEEFTDIFLSLDICRE